MTKQDYQLICNAAKKAHPVFVANQWTYWGSTGVPSESDIVGTLTELWFDLESNPDYMAIGSGRFRLMRDPEMQGHIVILLELGSTFQCEDYS